MSDQRTTASQDLACAFSILDLLAESEGWSDEELADLKDSYRQRVEQRPDQPSNSRNEPGSFECGGTHHAQA